LKRSKALKNKDRERSGVKRRVIREKKQQGCCVSPSECPAHLAPALSSIVCLSASPVTPQLTSVRFRSNRSEKKLTPQLCILYADSGKPQDLLNGARPEVREFLVSEKGKSIRLGMIWFLGAGG
jgi:hypothetical protein